jgi:hypothetical protein
VRRPGRPGKRGLSARRGCGDDDPDIITQGARIMSADPNRVILTGENPFIRLSATDDGPVTTNASFWRIFMSPAGAGHVLYLNSELTDGAWRIYSDNIAMARWLQSTVQGMLNPELADESLPAVNARFRRHGDARDAWTETVGAGSDHIALTWYRIGEPLLLHTQPFEDPARRYGLNTVLVPALGAQVTMNGRNATGQAWARQREGRAFSTCALAFAESWTEQR